MTNENKNPSTGVKGPVITVRLDADQMVKLANMVAKRMEEKKTPPAATEGVREVFVKCPTCGRPVLSTDNYCGRCGGPVKDIQKGLFRT